MFLIPWQFGLILFSLSASACLPITTLEPLPTKTPTLTPTRLTPTATIVWFPPTDTPTPFPTRVITPTPELKPGLGDVLFSDAFDDPSEWSLTASSQGTIAMNEGELSMAIPSGKTYLSSLRSEPLLKDFYLEVSAGPTLCNGMDEYGLLLRANENRDFYRFSLSCNGQVRLDRITGSVATSVLPWALSGAFPPGAPSLSHLGVWAAGDELRFFINDAYQFTFHDPEPRSGKIGLFARSSGAGALTVLFSNLVVREVNP